MAQNYIAINANTISSIKGACEGVANEIATTLTTLKEEFQTLCNETEYDPLVKVLNEFIEKANNEVGKKSSTLADTWVEEGFVAHAKRSYITDNNMIQPSKLDTDICDTIKQLWQNKPLGDGITCKLDSPTIDVTKYDDLKNSLDKASKAIHESKDKYTKVLTGDSDNFTTTGVALGAISAMADPIYNYITEMMGKVDKYKETAEAQNLAQREKNETINLSIIADSEELREAAAQLDMFGEI